ncbi:MAG: nitroreductase [Planctomycetota bacterium]
MTPPADFAAVVRARRTEKVLADPAQPVTFAPEVAAKHDAAVLAAVRDAGWAPFHYDRKADGVVEPWRVTVLEHAACRTVAGRLPEWLGDAVGKLPAMFAACGSAVVVSWLPQFRDGEKPATATEVNVDDEHLAAASAYTQTLLLSLTAGGFGTYWSSGGKLRTSEPGRAAFGLEPIARMLAIVFVDYPESKDFPVERVPGKHRDRRGDGWLTRASLD